MLKGDLPKAEEWHRDQRSLWWWAYDCHPLSTTSSAWCTSLCLPQALHIFYLCDVWRFSDTGIEAILMKSITFEGAPNLYTPGVCHQAGSPTLLNLPAVAESHISLLCSLLPVPGLWSFDERFGSVTATVGANDTAGVWIIRHTAMVKFPIMAITSIGDRSPTGDSDSPLKWILWAEWWRLTNINPLLVWVNIS